MTDISSILTRAPFTPSQRHYRWRALMARARRGTRVSTPAIRLSGFTLVENSAVDTLIGTLSVAGVTGVPTFTLVDSSSSKAKLTGSNILAGSTASNYETTPSFDIIVSVSGVTPAIANATFTINVTNIVEDTTPVFTPSAFTDQSGVDLASVITSNAITISAIDGPADVVITGTATSKEYRVAGGTWTSSAVTGSINNGQTLEVRGTSSVSGLTATTIIATVGGNVTSAVATTFTMTTAAADTTPSPFAFTDQTGAALSTSYESNAITVLGINAPATMTVTGGEYQKNGGAWASTSTTVVLNDSVKVRGTSSISYSTDVNVVLDISGVSDTFTIRTMDDPGTGDPDNMFDFTDPDNMKNLGLA